MTHLREAEFVDLLDNVLPAHRVRHVETCSTCAEQLETLRNALARAADVEVPEPSPLFWEHFSARVHDGVKDTTPAHVSPFTRWLPHGGVRWALAGALIIVVLLSANAWRQSTVQPPATLVAVTTDDPPDTLDVSAVGNDHAWDLVQALADDVHWDDQLEAGIDATPNTVEHAVLSLKGEERAELVRLLQAETKRPGA